jgi:hypothetical protein
MEGLRREKKMGGLYRCVLTSSEDPYEALGT